MVGALGLPAGFEKDLRNAIVAGDISAQRTAMSAIAKACSEPRIASRIKSAVSDRATAVLEALTENRMSDKDLSAAAVELQVFATLVREAEDVVTRAGLRKIALRHPSMLARAHETKTILETLSPKVPLSGTPGADRQRIESVLRTLHTDRDHIPVNVLRLRAIATHGQDKDSQEIIARGLGVSLVGMDPGGRASVLRALAAIERHTVWPSVRIAIIRGILENVSIGDTLEYVNAVVDGVASMALRSPDPVVKKWAIRLLERPKVKRKANTQRVDALVAQIKKSAEATKTARPNRKLEPPQPTRPQVPTNPFAILSSAVKLLLVALFVILATVVLLRGAPLDLFVK
jgi:hypothetical protein